MDTWVDSESADEAAITAAHRMRQVMAEGTDPRALQASLAADPDLFNAAWFWLTATERRAWKELTHG